MNYERTDKLTMKRRQTVDERWTKRHSRDVYITRYVISSWKQKPDELNKQNKQLYTTLPKKYQQINPYLQLQVTENQIMSSKCIMTSVDHVLNFLGCYCNREYLC